MTTEIEHKTAQNQQPANTRHHQVEKHMRKNPAKFIVETPVSLESPLANEREILVARVPLQAPEPGSTRVDQARAQASVVHTFRVVTPDQMALREVRVAQIQRPMPRAARPMIESQADTELVCVEFELGQLSN